MLPRHRGDPDPGLSIRPGIRRPHHCVVIVPHRPLPLHIDHHLLPHVQLEHVVEGLPRTGLRRQMGLCVRGRDDGEVAAEGGFDFLVEVVAFVCCRDGLLVVLES